MPTLSIVVPIYNISDYLPECIDSVLNQDYKDLELILVNDGSTDKSPSICEKYANKDGRIRVIHKKNGGLSDARNEGLNNAEGNYVFFLDGDDFLADNQLVKFETLLTNYENIDMFTFPEIHKSPSGKEETFSIPMSSDIEYYNRYDFLTKIIKNDFIFWGTGKNIYKKEIIDKYNLQYSLGLIGAEDCDFTMRFVHCSEQMCLVNTPLVKYRIGREGSITTNMSLNAIKGQLEVFFENYLIYKEDSTLARKDAKTFFANKFANTVYLLYHLKNSEGIGRVEKYISERKNVLNSTSGKKYDIAKSLWSILGYYKGSVLLNKIRKSSN